MVKKMLRIFIAEDEPIVMQGYKIIITGIGHSIVGTAMDGKSAVEKILETKPDLAIMDINMPLMDGLQAIERINKEYRLPYIVITGYQDQKLLERASELGVFGFLPKPVDECEIRNTIEIAMARFEQVNRLKQDLEQAQTALKERKIIERAKGILMEKAKVTEPQAMKHLQKTARDRNKKLIEVAQEIIEADHLFRV